MLRLETLPAGHGDCLWVEYGDPVRPGRLLIDGGTKGTYARALRPRLLSLPRDQRRFELLVITHVDADHISGILELLGDEEVGFSAADIWFNGYRHLPDESPDTLGPVQGERLTELLLKAGRPWNNAFGSRAVVVPPCGELPRVELGGGLVLTLLSPAPGQLAALKPVWEDEVRKAGLDPGGSPHGDAEAGEGFDLLAGEPPEVEELARTLFAEDTSEANGSAIALLAEHAGRRLLLTGDAHPGVLREAIGRLGPGPLTLAACKLSHHGSKGNTSRELLELLDCSSYIFSTNGSYFRHPDRETVARVITSGGAAPRLLFNYRSPFTIVWESRRLRETYSFRTQFPGAASEGIALEWD